MYIIPLKMDLVHRYLRSYYYYSLLVSCEISDLTTEHPAEHPQPRPQSRPQ